MIRPVVLLVVLVSLAYAQQSPTTNVEHQPLAAQVLRLLEALDLLNDPLPAAETAELKRLAAATGDSRNAAAQIQTILNRHCLFYVNINPESRVKAEAGIARGELIQNGWRTFLIRVENEAGVTAALELQSPNAGPLANASEGQVSNRFLDVQMFTKQPMRRLLSGLEVEYAILQVYSRQPGKREARFSFDVGQGTQDLGFRSQADILFTTKAASKVTLRILDTDDKPTTAAFTIRDGAGRIYPSQAKRLAPDLWFQPQIYRASGESVDLPDGEYSVEFARGPEYLKSTRRVKVDGPAELTFNLKRWIDPASQGWISGDHHIHAAGCAHYEKPTEGVYPADMMRYILGEDLKTGAVLTWGPGWYFQKTFFEGKENKLSTGDYHMRYDVEVSGFPSSHTGHIVLLGLKEQDYPGTKRIEDWPSWGIPVFRWAKSQGAVSGFAHSGWGLAYKEEKLPSLEMPPFDGIGANEFIVGVTQNLVDFISTVDTPYVNELNIWYHTLNAGYRARISGETDFPCIYGDRVGLGRSYVKQAKEAGYEDWVQGIREGRNYVSDGYSHLMDFKVENAEVGVKDSEIRLAGPSKVGITARVAARLGETPDKALQTRRYDQKPYWNIERARISGTRKVPVELIVNGQAVARTEVEADGAIRPLSFEYTVERSSWVALRILPSAHTNPVFVTVGGKPVHVAESIEWCMKAVDQCWKQKAPLIRVAERGEAQRVYDAARQEYARRLAAAR